MKGGFEVSDFKMPGMSGKGKKGGSNKLVGGAPGDTTTLVVTEGSEKGQYSVEIISDPAAADSDAAADSAAAADSDAAVVEEEKDNTIGGKRRKRKTAAKKSKKSKKSKKGSTRKARKGRK